MKRKLFALFLCLAMLVSLLAGCGNTADDTAEVPASAASTADAEAASEEAVEAEAPEAAADEAAAEVLASAEEAAPEEEPVEEEPAYFPLDETASFSFWIVYPPMFEGYADGPADYLYYQEAESRLNVELEFNAVPIPAANEQFMLMIAGGDYDDAILNFGGQYSGSLDQAIEEEIIINLTDALDAYAPDYRATQATAETRILSSYTEAGAEAALYGFQTSEGRIPKFGSVIRKDWLDELGLDIPVTVEDYHDVLLAFKDEMGATAPYGIAADGVTTPGSMQGAYDIVIPTSSDSNGFYQIDGTIHWGPLEEGFRDMLTTLNSWYNEGIIDSNFVSDTMSSSSGEVSSDKIASGTVGIWRGYATNLANYEEEIGGNAEVIGISPMRISEDATLHFGLDADNAASNMAISVSSTCEDVELVVRFFNYFFTEEGNLLANYGTEGFSFEYNEEGKPVFTDVITNNPDGMTMDVALCLYTGGSTSGPYEIDNTKNYITYTDAQLAAGQSWLEGTDGAYQLPDSYNKLITAEELEELNGYYNDIITTYNENILQFITGTRSLDEFDDFRDQLIDMGIENCIDIVQAGYDRYVARAA